MIKHIVRKNVKSGETILNGYSEEMTAPIESGEYNLIQWASESNSHIRFEWEKINKTK